LNRFASLIAWLALASTAFGQIKFSELPTKTAAGSTASQIFFPLVEMDGSPATARMSAVELGTLIGAVGGGLTNGDKGDIVVGSLGESLTFDSGVVTAFSKTLLDDANATTWRSTLGLGTAALSATGDFVAPNTTPTLTGVVLNGGSVTVDTPMINAAQFWNSGAVFTGWKLDIQNGGASASSKMLDLLVGGASKFSVGLTGAPTIGAAYTLPATDGTNGHVLKTNGAGVVTWQADSGGGVSDGDKGHIVVSGSGATWNLDTDATPTVKGVILSGGSVSVDTPLINAAQVWSGGGTLTGWKLDIQDGGAGASSKLVDLLVGGATKFSVGLSGEITVNGDTVLARDAADVFAMRRSTNPQEMRVYNTDNGANDEYLTIDWDTNVAEIGTMKTGTGVGRDLYLKVNDADKLLIKSNNDHVLVGSLRSSNVATYDLGMDGVPWRTVYTNDIVVATKTPATASAAGTTGMIAWDANYIYICTATNTWKRVAIATW
jgi:hypothetical protein